MDKQFVASEIQVKSGHFRLLYSCPEAVVGSDKWNQLLLESSQKKVCSLIPLIFAYGFHLVQIWHN